MRHGCNDYIGQISENLKMYIEVIKDLLQTHICMYVHFTYELTCTYNT